MPVIRIKVRAIIRIILNLLLIFRYVDHIIHLKYIEFVYITSTQTPHNYHIISFWRSTDYTNPFESLTPSMCRATAIGEGGL